ncbi:MAG: glycosyltransferase [Microcoleaceae cyanobacterium]
MSKKLRVLYAAGPGNVIKTYSNYWVKDRDDPSTIAVTYSSQFYDVCTALDAEAYLISSYPEKNFLKTDRFTLEHRPILGLKKGGIFYHLGQIWYGIRLIISAILFRADAVIIVEGSTHLFVMSILPLLGIEVIPLLQCVLWPTYGHRSQSNKLIWNLSKYLFSKGCFATLSLSRDISNQVKEIAGGKARPIVEYLPYYHQSGFKEISKTAVHHSPFRVLFAGRIEENKGVFDILEVAKNFKKEGIKNIIFDICGVGSALEKLKQEVKAAGLDSTFVCHGFCNREKMLPLFEQASILVVPTKKDFIEGFNKVVVEGILSSRPVVSSAVCPALFYLKDAVIEVEPDDIKGYGDAILKLYSNPDFYQQKVQACVDLQEQFYDPKNSFGNALKLVLLNLREKGKSTAVLVDDLDENQAKIKSPNLINS